MSLSGLSSPRPDCFPAGLRVLVVDDDPTWLKILEKMLKKCNYEVRTCSLARQALDLLRERKNGFDIVISDVNMPDMDGFKLLEHVGLEMDLPVIMMSVDGETRRVMKGVQHGACDYLLKPIRMKELRNIWQHVLRKRIHEVRDVEGQEILDEIYTARHGTEQSDDGYWFGGDVNLGRKRKDVNGKHEDRLYLDASSAKKARVVWTVDLHQKFVKAVNLVGIDKVGPKKILDLMGVPWLTRENVASHLQKYRLYLGRLQKNNELKPTFGGIKSSAIPSGESSVAACLQTSTILPQKTSRTENAAPENRFLVQKDDPQICKVNAGGILPIQITESKNPLFGENTDPKSRFGENTDCLRNCMSRISSVRPFGISGVNSAPNSGAQFSWGPEAPSVQFKQEKKPCPRSEHKPTVSINRPSSGTSKGKETGKLTSDAAEVFVHPQNQPLEQMSWEIPNLKWGTKKTDTEKNMFADLGTLQRNSDVEIGTAIRPWDGEFNCFSPQADFNPTNGDFGVSGCSNLDLTAEVPEYMYNLSSFDYEYPTEPVEYPVIDQVPPVCIISSNEIKSGHLEKNSHTCFSSERILQNR